MKINGVVFDIDGVLTTQGGPLMDLSVKLINNLKKHLPVSFASGKYTEYISAMLKKNGIDFSNIFIVSENGGVFFDPSKNKEVKSELFVEDLYEFKRTINFRDDNIIKIGNRTVKAWRESKKTIFNVLTFNNEEVPLIADYFNKIIKDNGYNLMVFSHGDGVDVVPKGIDKSEGIKVLSEHLGIPPKNLCAFGDGSNDIPMMGVVGMPIAVANAKDEVKEAVRKNNGFIASKPYIHGVLEGFNYMKEKNMLSIDMDFNFGE